MSDQTLRTHAMTQRLLALLALRPRLQRRKVAAALWPEVSEERAAGNLRTLLWRLQSLRSELLCLDDQTIGLSDNVCVDVHELEHLQSRLISSPASAPPLARLAELLGRELLPGWSEDWVIFERERLRQRDLHLWERLADWQLHHDQCWDALEMALSIVEREPLRESAHRLVIKVHLQEGNASEAMRAYAQYCAMAQRELGIGPSSELRALRAQMAVL
ncbi:DNA-binding transcriptional activator of the SARP family [Friedmanniella luteola]|uniref:DNA-binding transcriptional activator of the SARP family n=1 Tax=Friedmanniella luteola TaxID=546871 RepID=A0A1H1VFR5_9ACTN|nr:BTAD domain-containing putative transcriptional regulator [Friedmanniella luteola]SDS83634.1 DNA-binding transcriptional activator of the SARP family [Friedmanniella luteola]